MKAVGLLGLCLAMLPSLSLGQVIYDDAQIRTWTKTFSGMDIMDNRKYNLPITNLPIGFSNDKIVGVKVLVYSDEALQNGPEVFDLTRQSGMRIYPLEGATRPNGRSGGWAHLFMTNPGSGNGPFFYFDSGSRRTAGGVPYNGFFVADFKNHPARQFRSTTNVRCVLTIDYLCGNSCTDPATNTIWAKIGNWQMESSFSTHSTALDMSRYGVNSQNFVDMSAAIQSDPDANGKIQVDDLEHESGNRGGISGINTPKWRGRGGIMWYGYGCVTGDPNQSDCRGDGSLKLHLYAGPFASHDFPGEPNQPVTNYGQGNFTMAVGQQPIPVRYASASVNRGWIRVEYTGTKSGTPIPYAMKTKVMEIGTWNMPGVPGDPNDTNMYHKLSFAPFGIAANRVSRIMTTTRSDLITGAEGTGYEFTNFHRPASPSGTGIGSNDEEHLGGGGTFIHEPDGAIYLTQTLQNNFYHARPGYSGAGNRGFILVDYLAGSCEQGPTGFKIQGVPGIQVGDCSGNASPFTFEGAGSGRVNGVGSDIWGSADDFTFMSKSGSGDMDVQVKIESQDPIASTAGWAKSGIMIRSDMTAGAREASFLVTPAKKDPITGAITPGNGAHLNFRATMGGTTDRIPCQSCSNNAIMAPYYLRLVKTGTTFTAFARKLSTDGWTNIGSAIVGGFPTNYYYGLAQTSYSPNLAKSVFSGFASSSIPYYKIINKNSGKALEVAGSSTVSGGNVDQRTYNSQSNMLWQLINLGGGYWRIVNKNSGLSLDVSGGSTTNGANVQQWPWTGATNQQWQITDLTTGWYKVTARHSSKALDVNAASTADGANVQQWDWLSGANQQWQFLLP